MAIFLESFQPSGCSDSSIGFIPFQADDQRSKGPPKLAKLAGTQIRVGNLRPHGFCRRI